MPYNVYVKSFVKNTCFAILPTSSCNANSCIITSASVCPIITPQNKAIYAYPAAISDARYILSGSISGGGVSYPDITDNTSSQYVGIVQTNPQYTLDVNGTVAASSIISDSITNTNGDALTIDSTGILQLDSTYQINLLAGSVYSINLHSGYDANIYAQQGFNVHCYTSSAFLSTPIGFGINQSNPQYTLDVNGQIGNSFYNNNNYIILDDDKCR